MPLNPFAFWAAISSQILTERARLNRRQLHWRTASRALRALVLSVEHVSLSYARAGPLQFGICNVLECRSADAVFSITRSVFSHFMQSKVHRPKPGFAGLILARTIGFLHLGQGCASMLFAGARANRNAGERFPLRWAGALPNSLSPMAAEDGAVMQPACAFESRTRWSILLTFRN